MNRLRDSGANQMHYPQKINAIADAKFAALITRPIQPSVSCPDSKKSLDNFQVHQLKNKSTITITSPQI
jgi:hypothetical protein